MSTNYYVTPVTSPFRQYARSDWESVREDHDMIPIGQSSCGWCFALNVNANIGIHDFPDLQAIYRCANMQIINECDNVIETAEMDLIIMSRRGIADAPPRTPEYLEKNNAVEGPFNLMRRRIDNLHCIGHGAGTWDLVVGDLV